jgi:hypothetical protein
MTTPSHPDFGNLQKGAQDVVNLIQYCNESKRAAEKGIATTTALSKITAHESTPTLSLLKPNPRRGLVAEIHSMLILKWVQHYESKLGLDPIRMSKGKKSQVIFDQKGPLLEWKFKPIKDLNPSKWARLIEQGGIAARFDCVELRGKRCSFFLCDDLIIFCNSSMDYVGAMPVSEQTTASCLPVSSSFGRDSETAIIRISHGSSIAYLLSSLTQAVQLVSLINSLV